MIPQLFVHLPYNQLREQLPLLLERQLQPEVAFRGEDLDQLDPELVDQAASSLADRGLTCTVHGPFFDLNPGAIEPLVFEATVLRYRQTLAAAHRLGARTVVFHPGYEYWKYGGRDYYWLDASLQFWPGLIELAEQLNLQLAVENIYETHPGTLHDLLLRLDSPTLGHCFDIGHWRLFSDTSLENWFRALGDRVVHLHLHDNTGTGDDHLPIGEGDIDFAELFDLLGELDSIPTLTLEAHSLEDLERSLESCRPLLQTLFPDHL